MGVQYPKKKINILIIAHFCGGNGESTNNRFNYLYDLFRNEMKVSLLTSSFSHRDKIQRFEDNSDCCDINYVYEVGYKRNISLKRVYSHRMFGRNLKTYLETIIAPDIIYCGFPSIEVGSVVRKYCKKNNVKMMLDIQDLWPEAFYMILGETFFTKLILKPLTYKANKVFSAAEAVVTVSNTYMKRIESLKKIPAYKRVVYLGTDLCKYESLEGKSTGDNHDCITLAYIGTLGKSYDIELVIDALQIINKKYGFPINFIVMGDGPEIERLKNYSRKKNIPVDFRGRLDFDRMASILMKCDIAINPIKPGSAGSIINKVCDYAAASLPVINTQDSSEYRALLKEYKFGLNCDPNSAVDVAEKIYYLSQNHILRIKMGCNNRKMAEKLMNREVSYMKILDLVKDVHNAQ